MEKIRTEVDFINKLNDIGEMFGVRFYLRGRDVYMTDAEGKQVKMQNNGSHYSGKINGKEIGFNYIYSEHCFSTSVLIEVFANDGKKRDFCRIEQELRPQSGIRAYPSFMYNSFQNGKTYLFYSNSFLIETIITSGMNTHMFEAVKKYENDGNIKSVDRVTARFAKPDISRFLCGVDDGEGAIYPQAEFEMYKGAKGHHYKLWVLAGNCRIYQAITGMYKYDPEGFYAMVPFFKRECKGEDQYIEDVHPLTQEAWNNLLLSIIQNKGAISCFEETMKYCDKSIASSFIYENYASLIDAVRGLQASGVTVEKPFGKILQNSIPRIEDK